MSLTNHTTHQESLTRLKEGNTRFVEDMLNNDLQDSSRRESLINKQEPYAIILGCADSRVVPELAFDAGLGELFTVRVAGNIANTLSIASMEYAVEHLGSKLIVVLGHQSCRAVTATVDRGDNGYNLYMLLAHGTSAIDASEKDACIDDIVKENVELNAADLLVRSSIISRAVQCGDVRIVSAYYHLKTGEVEFLD